ncbi:MAG: toprim domain-containing protein [Thermoguttaceae bacterium]|nr:toprim domain-containing protein [Thermoguttaceae bacterium]
MSPSFDSSFDQREQIREAIDIVDLVERYVPLRRQGGNFVGLCPWHNDSRPSLQVNPQRQTFKCWVCDIGGDAFSFVMKMENVDFKESMKILADMAGIELIERPKRRRARQIAAPAGPGAPEGFEEAPIELPRDVDKRAIYAALGWLAGKYRETLLTSPEAEEARAYVRERGISEASSEKFGLGYAPSSYEAVLDWIGGDRFRTRVLEAAGVLAFREEFDERGYPLPRPVPPNAKQLTDAERRRYYDRFRGRLIFPIRDVQDRVVAFGGRLLPNSSIKSPAKYVNSPETPVFTKSKMLYGLDLARNASREKKTVLITEGYTDCIAASQFGFENVVAVLGTALGSEHVRVLKRFAEKMILLLDGDEAGRRRASEVLRFFVEQGVDMSVLTLPNDADPCEFLLENGADEFARLLKTAPVDALERAFETATAGIDLDDDVVGSAKALDSLLDVVSLFPEKSRASNDPARLRFIKTIQRLSTRFRVSEEEIRNQLAQKRERNAQRFRRDEDRENRRADRAPDAIGPETAPIDPEEAKIAQFRRDWIYPAPNEEDETDEELRERFAPFERFLLRDPQFRPSALETEYLEIWLAAPDLFPRLVASVDVDELRSPIARQLELVARDYLERGLSPTFDRLALRYEDVDMKGVLADLADDADAKNLPKLLADPETRETIFRDVFAGFERARLVREEPKIVGSLREGSLDPDDKIKALEKLRDAVRASQENRKANMIYNEEIDNREE